MTDQPTMTSAQMVERSSGVTAWWIFEHQDGDKFFADRDQQHGKMIANAYWGENTWTKTKLYAAPPAAPPVAGETELTPEQIYLINDMIHAWLDPDKKGEFRQAFRNDCKRLLATLAALSRPAVASPGESSDV